MKKLFAAAAFAALFATPTFAADLALKAPPAPVPVYGNWSGPYVGLQAGWVWGRPSYTYNFGGPAPTSVGVDVGGVVAGASAGYNWQNGQIVYGAEGDISYADVDGNIATSSTPPCYVEGCTGKLSWFGTGRARLGYVAGGFLPYITGGFAVGEIKSSADLGACDYVGSCGFDTTRLGWTAGGGIEWKLNANWSAKVEYLYLNFGSPSFNSPAVTTSDFAVNVVRGGVNMHF
jgi:outer membrane immunogenic protein